MNIGSLEVMLGANTAGLSRAAVNMKRFETQVLGSNAKMQGSFQALGSQMMLTGTMLTQFLTVPIMLLGGVAVKTFSSYETQIAKIVALTGTSLEQANKWSTQILGLSKEFGQAPKDVASAMYFIASPALKASTSMDILKASTKGAAIGLGETKTIANALVSVINAYGESNISASGALDIMIASVKNGKFEAEDMAKVLGKVLPTAQALGVTFSDLGASIAAMTLTGKSASEASTQLNRLFTTLIQAPPKAEKVLDGLGISFSTLRKDLRDEGMMKTIQDLGKMIGGNTLDTIQSTKAYQDNISVVGDVFTNLRALLPVLDMLGPNMKNWVSTIAATNTAAGSSDTAWKTVSNTIENRFNRVVADAKVSLIKFGDVIKGPLMNIIQNLMGWVNKLADNFAKLPESTQGMIVSFTLIAAALGPLMLILGPLVSGMANLIGFMVGGSLAAAVGWWLLLAYAVYEVYKNWEMVKKAFADFDWSSFGKGIVAAMGSLVPGLGQGLAMMQGMQGALVNADIEWNKYASTVKGANESMVMITEKTKEYNGLIKQMEGTTTLEGRKKVYEDIQKVLENLKNAYDAVINEDGKTKSFDEGGNIAKALAARRKILDELDRSAKQKVNDLDVGFGDVGKKFVADAMNGINSLQKMVTGLDLTKLTKGLGIADTTNEVEKLNSAMALWKIQKSAIIAMKEPQLAVSRTSLPIDTYSTFTDTIKGTNAALAINAEIAKALGSDYDKTSRDVEILTKALDEMIPKNSAELALITPEQITAVQQYLALLEQLKTKTQDNVKVLTAWKNLFRDISSLAGTIGKYLGDGFQQVFQVIQDIVSGVSQFIAIIRDISKIGDLTKDLSKDKETASITANTIAIGANSVAQGVNIGSTTAMVVANQALSAAASQLAISEAVAAAAWIPFPGNIAAMGTSVAAAIAALATAIPVAGAAAVGLAQGGTVPSGFPNDSFPAMLTSGETVIPLTKMATMFGNKANQEQQQVIFKIHRKELVGILENAQLINKSF